MPELPEVETIVRDLRPLLRGRSFVAVLASRKRLRCAWDRRWNDEVCHRRIVRLSRRGKWIVLDLANNGTPMHLLFHMGMSGQLVVMPAEHPTAKHTHLTFTLDGGQQQLRLRDPRRFGGATVVTGEKSLADFFGSKKLGPEPARITPKDWANRLSRTERCLKAALLDQSLVAGVGNIYADESLWEARLHPAQRACDTTPQQAELLRRAIVKVLNRAIDAHGSSIRDYVGGNGTQGNYQQEFRIYGQEGQPCRRCRTKVVLTRLAGRASHYCPQCQMSVVRCP
jgi:formamidopyrimidine-DNA glycosylase